MSILNSATDGYVVTPSDTLPLPRGISDFLYVTASGNLAFITEGGTTIPSFAVLAGQTIPYRVSQVLATGTSATVLAAHK